MSCESFPSFQLTCDQCQTMLTVFIGFLHHAGSPPPASQSVSQFTHQCRCHVSIDTPSSVYLFLSKFRKLCFGSDKTKYVALTYKQTRHIFKQASLYHMSCKIKMHKILNILYNISYVQITLAS